MTTAPADDLAGRPEPDGRTTDRVVSRVSPGTPTGVIVVGLIGTSLEWYDFFLYSTASELVFNRLFFPGRGVRGPTAGAARGALLEGAAQPSAGAADHRGCPDRHRRRVAPIVAIGLVRWTGTALSVSVYVLTMSLLTLVALRFAPETYRADLD
jgi:hypothetical protein